MTETPINPDTQNVIKRNLRNEMSTAYIDYAMSVIIGRAIPDIRDGLKPVQRRILYSMAVNNFYHNQSHRKCATIVGHVLGHYHPHGDSSVYDALVRLAQDFSLRYTLVDGQGNFGSIDGDSAAAYRYTEARLARISGEMLEDIEKQTVDYQDNFDGSEQEPAYLPAKLPNLLLNGTTGIAVGMSTNIAPHNLREVVNAICAAIDVGPSNFTPMDVLKYIKGPDFPTGGIIMGRKGIIQSVTTGRGAVVVRGKTDIVKDGAGKNKDAIIITEIPYMVNKARMIETIAENVNKGTIPEISDIRDESDRNGMRVVIELKKNADANACLNKLFIRSQLQSSFNMINLMLIENGKQPTILDYAEILRQFIQHRLDVIRRRTEFDLRKAENRLHIIDGLLIAIQNIDEVVRIIKNSSEISVANQNLQNKFNLSEIQASEILKMPLSRLTNLQTQKLSDEKADLIEKILYFKSILEDKAKIYAIIKQESKELAEKYGDDRRTEIVELDEPLSIDFAETIAEEQCVIFITQNQQIKRMSLEVYQSQNRGGKGKRGMQMREEDIVLEMFTASSHDTILLFTQQGRVYSIPAYKLPLTSRNARGKAIVNFVNLKPDEIVIDITNLSQTNNESCLIFVTSRGLIKKTKLDAFQNIRKTGINCMNILENDSLVRVKKCNKEDEILIATKLGYAIRFKEEELRAMGRNAQGVKGISLRTESDEVVDLVVSDPDTKIVTITKKGYGKHSKLDLYRLTHRGGKGVINIKLRSTKDEVIAIKSVPNEMNLLLASINGIIIRIRSEDIRETGRAAKGVIVMKLDEDDEISSVALCDAEDAEICSEVTKIEDADDDEVEDEEIEDTDDDEVEDSEDDQVEDSEDDQVEDTDDDEVEDEEIEDSEDDQVEDTDDDEIEDSEDDETD